MPVTPVEETADPLAEILASAEHAVASSEARSRTTGDPTDPPWAEEWPDDRASERPEPEASLRAMRDASPTRSPEYEIPLRQSFIEASPLLIVAAACFGLGIYLHQTANAGPVPVLPVWTLFFALGFVAALGAGGSLVLSGEPEFPDGYVRAKGSKTPRAERPPMTRSVATSRRPSIHRPPSVELSRPTAAPSVPPGARGEAKETESIASKWVDPALLGSPVLPEDLDRPSSAEVLEQIDRLLADLKPLRARSSSA